MAIRLGLLCGVVVAAWLLGLRPPASSTLACVVVLAILRGLVEPGAPETRGDLPPLAGLVDVASFVLLGPIWGASLSGAAVLFAGGPGAWGLQIGAAVVAALETAGAGLAYQAAGSRAGTFAVPGDLPAMAIAIAAYAGGGALGGAVLRRFADGPEVPGGVRAALWDGVRQRLGLSGFGVPLALAGAYAGVTGLIVCAPGLLLTRRALWRDLEIRHDLKDFVRALSEVLDEVDPYTRQHSVRVAVYANRLARSMGCSERELEDLEYAALVHDLGKIGPQNQRILQKVGALSEEEHQTLRGHPGTGAGILGTVRALRRSAEIVRLHHERPDGLGYPFGLMGHAVPRGARILNVADAFDAMTSDRSYRRALDLEAALGELRRGADREFDGEVVRHLLALQEEGRFRLLASPSREELQRLRLRPPRVRA